MNGQRHPVLFHVDMNSFYAAIEMLDDPSLKDKPIAIAGNPKERRGIVVTSNYNARAFGVKTTMPVWEARKKCPELVVRPPRFDRYREVSASIFSYLRSYTPLVEPVSIDECYMDVSALIEAGENEALAERVQDGLLREIGLPSSIGVAPNKFLAKMASDMKKPAGITILRKRDLGKILWPLDIVEMHGIGAKTANKMRYYGITTIGELAKADVHELEGWFGIRGRDFYEKANGIDRRPVDPKAHETFKSVGQSRTYPVDVHEQATAYHHIQQLAQSLANRLERKQVCSSNIQLTMRFSDRRTITRSCTLQNPVAEASELAKAAGKLLDEYWDGSSYRLLGITALNVIKRSEAYYQLSLFNWQQAAEEGAEYN